MSLGKQLSGLRKKNQLTQNQLAKALGITRSALSHYELDTREPDYQLLKKMSAFFDSSIDYLLDAHPSNNSTKTISVDGLDDDEIIQIEHLIDLLRKKKK